MDLQKDTWLDRITANGEKEQKEGEKKSHLIDWLVGEMSVFTSSVIIEVRSRGARHVVCPLKGLCWLKVWAKDSNYLTERVENKETSILFVTEKNMIIEPKSKHKNTENVSLVILGTVGPVGLV